MRCVIKGSRLQAALQRLVGVVDKKQNKPILSHALMRVHSHHIELLATDMEIALATQVSLPEAAESGSVTVCLRKLLDICRSLPDEADLNIHHTEDRLLIKAGCSEFVLRTLPVDAFPHADMGPAQLEFKLSQKILHTLLSSTYFSMAHQDVRYYLNGMLWQITKKHIKAITTDGHRLSFCQVPCEIEQTTEILLPRKGVLELMRLLDDRELDLQMAVGKNMIEVKTDTFVFTCKRIEGQFPDVASVIPKQEEGFVDLPREDCKHALQQVAILSSDKCTGIRLQLSEGNLELSSESPEKEHIESKININYQGKPLDMGFNVNYLLDVVNNIGSPMVRLFLTDANSSILLRPEPMDTNCGYIIMPMRL